jgi:hypothetical protein
LLGLPPQDHPTVELHNTRYQVCDMRLNSFDVDSTLSRVRWMAEPGDESRW